MVSLTYVVGCPLSEPEISPNFSPLTVTCIPVPRLACEVLVLERSLIVSFPLPFFLFFLLLRPLEIVKNRSRLRDAWVLASEERTKSTP